MEGIGEIIVGLERFDEGSVAEGRDLDEGLGLAAEFDLFVVGDVEAGLVETNVGADVPGR